jgi:hypothetical protein
MAYTIHKCGGPREIEQPKNLNLSLSLSSDFDLLFSNQTVGGQADRLRDRESDRERETQRETDR